MKQKIKYFSLIFFPTLFIFFLLTPIRGGYFRILELTGFPLVALLGFILFFALTYFFIYKFNNKFSTAFILLFVFLGATAIKLPFHIIHFESTLVSFPETIIHVLGILAGYLSYKIKKRNLKVTVVLISLFCGFWLSIYGYRYFFNQLNYGNFAGNVKEEAISDFEMYNDISDSIAFSSFKGKYLVLDCWNTFCGGCYEKLPLLQELCNHYNTNPDIQIFAFHNWLDEEDASTGNKVLKERGYSIPCVSIDMDNKILEEMGVRVYPTVLVFDKDSRLIYRGNIEGAIKLIHKLMDD